MLTLDLITIITGQGTSETNMIEIYLLQWWDMMSTMDILADWQLVMVLVEEVECPIIKANTNRSQQMFYRVELYWKSFIYFRSGKSQILSLVGKIEKVGRLMKTGVYKRYTSNFMNNSWRFYLGENRWIWSC